MLGTNYRGITYVVIYKDFDDNFQRFMTDEYDSVIGFISDFILTSRENNLYDVYKISPTKNKVSIMEITLENGQNLSLIAKETLKGEETG